MRAGILNTTRVASFNMIPQLAHDLARQFIKAARRPVFLGDVAIAIGWSLERTGEVIGRLQQLGQVRVATGPEMVFVGACHPDCQVFVHVDNS